ncbi:unnamed protein product [Blepharisma stoltei]|uniref:Uncharacterized protein n=1 Tax=Blepharisma stoltei TaxID=1481888 RepID=A0AAU9IFM0_9CILI|nr:unnamed protein product [Blepharisma stoltei]
MVESRYTAPRIVRKQSNRHMVKCYPSYEESKQKLREFQTKVKFWKNEAELQGNVIDWVYEESLKQFKQEPDTANCVILKVPGGLVGYRAYDIKNDKRLQLPFRSLGGGFSEGNKNSSQKNSSSGLKLRQPQELYESSLYINHNTDK